MWTRFQPTFVVRFCSIHQYIISTLYQITSRGHWNETSWKLQRTAYKEHVRKFLQTLVCIELFISASCLGNELNMYTLCWYIFFTRITSYWRRDSSQHLLPVIHVVWYGIRKNCILFIFKHSRGSLVPFIQHYNVIFILQLIEEEEFCCYNQYSLRQHILHGTKIEDMS